MIELSARSKQRLDGIHCDLVRVINRAAEIADFEFQVTEGLRTLDRQKQLVAQGASQTLKSRHLTGHAVDLVVLLDGKVRWDWPLYHKLARLVKEAARLENMSIECGADWVKFPDGPHFQLPLKDYPA